MGGIYQAAALRRAEASFIATALEELLPPIREVARSCGYAIAVHGSLARDIDLIACPWREGASEPDELVAAIVGVVAGVFGRCRQNGDAGNKPHGRRAYTLIHAGHIGEIDLSVMPRIGAVS